MTYENESHHTTRIAVEKHAKAMLRAGLHTNIAYARR
jgi:hypothetical protein